MAQEINNPEDEKTEGEEQVIPQADSQVQELQAKVKQLEELIRSTADAGRLMNYDSSKGEKKPFRVKLSVWNGGLIVGWRTVKDELVKHPTTGRTVGESQQYEILVMDKEGKTTKALVDGYPAFSAARYDERVEAEVVGKKEEWDGKVTLDLSLPDGRTIPLDSRFVN